MAVFRGVVSNCVVCGEEMRRPQCQAHVKTCSTECGYKARKVANKKDKVECTCVYCGKTFYEHESHAGRRKYCGNICREADPKTQERRSARFSGNSNPQWTGKGRICISENGRRYRRAAPDKELAKLAKRRAAKRSATPTWANADMVMWYYSEAEKLRKATGIEYHVDHIVPLTSNKVCGLHVEFNLQILPATANLRKHNRYWPDMP